jgi:hypothetical protein
LAKEVLTMPPFSAQSRRDDEKKRKRKKPPAPAKESSVGGKTPSQLAAEARADTVKRMKSFVEQTARQEMTMLGRLMTNPNTSRFERRRILRRLNQLPRDVDQRLRNIDARAGLREFQIGGRQRTQSRVVENRLARLERGFQRQGAEDPRGAAVSALRADFAGSPDLSEALEARVAQTAPFRSRPFFGEVGGMRERPSAVDRERAVQSQLDELQRQSRTRRLDEMSRNPDLADLPTPFMHRRLQGEKAPLRETLNQQTGVPGLMPGIPPHRDAARRFQLPFGLEQAAEFKRAGISSPDIDDIENLLSPLPVRRRDEELFDTLTGELMR